MYAHIASFHFTSREGMFPLAHLLRAHFPVEVGTGNKQLEIDIQTLTHTHLICDLTHAAVHPFKRMVKALLLKKGGGKANKKKLSQLVGPFM